VKNASVSAKVLEHGRNRKILVYKKKRRKGYQRKNGHRQDYTLIQIDTVGVKKTTSKAAPKTETAEAIKATNTGKE